MSDINPIVIKYVQNNERPIPIFAQLDIVDYYVDFYNSTLGTKLDVAVAFDLLDKRVEDEKENEFLKSVIGWLYRQARKNEENLMAYKISDTAFRHEYLDRMEEDKKA